MRLRLGLLLLLVGCDAAVLREDGGDAGGDAMEVDRPATACGGALTTTPRVLATGLAAGRLHLAGDHIILAEHDSGRILAVDRCSGETTVLAELGDELSQIAVVGEEVVAAIAAPESHRLVRFHLEGGEPEVVVDIPDLRSIVAHAGRLSALIGVRDDGAGGEPDELGVFTVDLDAGTVTEISRFENSYGGSCGLAAASNAGVYVAFYPHGGPTSLSLAPIGGGALLALADSANVDGAAVSGETLLLRASPEPYTSGDERALLRMALDGSNVEVLLGEHPDFMNDSSRLVANQETVCWSSYGEVDQQAKHLVRCMRVTAGAEVRTVNPQGEHELGDLLMAPDALYWMRGDGSDHELVAAVP